MSPVRGWISWSARGALMLAAACGDPSELESGFSPTAPNGGSFAPADAAYADTGADPGAVLDATQLGPSHDAAQPDPSGDAAQSDPSGGRDAGGPGPVDGGAQTADAGSLADAALAPEAGVITPSTCAVQPLPEALRASYRMGAIYKRYADANGVPVVASEKPSDEAIRRACLLVLDYSSVRSDVREALLNRKVRFIMMARTEKTVNFPEYAALGDLDQRARGLGGVTDAICAEENVLCERATDRWRGEGICVHEYAHTMHSGAWNVAIPNFNSRLDAAYRAALAAGKYANTYAGSKLSEYLAEGVQDWYNTNLESATPNGIHNHVNTRAELQAYDPTLYALLSEVLPDKPSYRDCYYYE